MKKILLVLMCMIGHGLVAMNRTKPMMFNPRLLKGTHEIEGVPSEYAPVRGLTFLDCKISEQWYRQSPKFQKKDMEAWIARAKASGQTYVHWDNVQKVVDDYKNNAIQNLIMQMYHVAGGTFTVTNALNNPVRQYSPYIIGRILRLVHEATQSAAVDFKKLQTQLEEELTKFQLKDGSGKPFKPKDHRPFVNALIAALQDVSDLYPQYTVQGVLIGYMLSKSNIKDDIQKYVRGFTGKDIVLGDQLYSVSELKRIVSQQYVTRTPWIKFADFICARVFFDVYSAKLPAITSSKSILYQKYEFTDCVESTLLNVANIVTYGDGRLGSVFPQEAQLSKQLMDFYAIELHQYSAEVENLNVHKAWAQCVENVQGCLYNRVGVSDTAAFEQVSQEFEGFMPMPASMIDTTLPRYTITMNNRSYEMYVHTVGTQKFLLVPDNLGLVCFELMPTLSNIIVLMNFLFGLNLYQHQADVLNVDFEQTVFPKLCQKFDWRIETVHYGALSKDITVHTDKGLFVIHLMHKAHGYVSANKGSHDTVSVLRLSQLHGFSNEPSNIDTSQLLMLNVVSYNNVMRLGLFFVPMLNLDRCNDHLIQAIEYQVPEQYIVSLMRYMMLNSQDRHYWDNVLRIVFQKIKQPSKAVFDLLVMWSIKLDSSIAVLGLLGEQYQVWLQDLVHEDIPMRDQDFYIIDRLICNYVLNSFHKKGLINFINRAKEKEIVMTLRVMHSLVSMGIVDKSDRAFLLDMVNFAKEKNVRSTMDFMQLLVNKRIVDKNDRSLILDMVNLGKEKELGAGLRLMRSLADKGIIDKNDRSLILDLVNRGTEEDLSDILILVRIIIERNIVDKNDRNLLLEIATSKHSVKLIRLLVDQDILDKQDKNLFVAMFRQQLKMDDGYYENGYYWRTMLPSDNDVLELAVSLVGKKIVDRNDRELLLGLVNQGKEKYMRQALELMSSLVDEGLVDKNDRELLLALINQGKQSNDYLYQAERLEKSLVDKGIDLSNQPQALGKSLVSGTRPNLMRHDPAQAIALNQAKYLQQAGVGQQDQSGEQYDELAAREMEKQRARVAQAVESMQSGDHGVPHVRTSPVVVQTLPKVSAVPVQSKAISPQVAVSKAMQKGFKPIARR
ncbi:hypothetical protein KBD08_04340 [Candidatus Babeliales bacterium]|nr:hypothetical protein [Candidatus Babeliales bacterium]